MSGHDLPDYGVPTGFVPRRIQAPAPAPAPAPKAPSALDVQVGGGHYKKTAIQPIQYIHSNGIPFAEGCVIKYVSRWRDKGGIQDLEKAKHFLELLIELEKAKA